MDIELSPEQRQLVDTTERFISAEYPLTTVREHLRSAGPSDAYRRRTAELGWYGLLVPEELGGGKVSANGVRDAALVARARGATLQPGNFIDATVVGFALAHGAGSDQRSDVLPRLLAGEASTCWVVAGAAASADALVAERDGGRWTISGAATDVQEAEPDACLLITASSGDGPVQLMVAADSPGVRRELREGLDLTRRFYQVALDAVSVDADAVLGTPGGQTEALLERQRQIACTLTISESLGAMQHLLETTIEYAKARIAFGRPIGSFQAVKHMLADASLILEMGKAIAGTAIEAVGDRASDASALVSAAKAFVADGGIDVAQTCLQVLGGIGYTWEHDHHLYLRRITADAARFGDAIFHRERICRLKGI